jgi:Zn-dependent M28 family amino/carboxypeptidase
MRFFLTSFCTLLLCITTAGFADDADLQLQNRLQAHINFLADDLMLGRQPGSDGYNIAANYVASQFQQAGLTPAGDEGSFFQQVPLRQAFLQQGSAEMTLKRGDQSTSFTFLEQFYMSPSLGRTSSSLEADLVFVGYGIDAPELEHRDYAGIDVEGKIVVQLAGQPQSFPSEEGAHFASTTQRLEAAVRHGAVGVVMIHTPRAAKRFPWDRLRGMVGTPSMGWVNAQGNVHGEFEQLQAGAFMRHSAAEILFENAELDMAALLERDEQGEALPRFDLNGRVSLSQRSTHGDLTSPNVVAMLPGSDPLLASEYVVYIAHLDHLGELHSSDDETDQKDLINNGAMDNASGVSVMLETARLFTQAESPRRSVLFVAVTAEEKGLVGSEYFAMNPTVPLNSIVSTVNLDMPVLLYDFADVIAFGSEHSSLGETVRDAAASYAIELSPDPFPEQNIFVRSDHYRFVQQGIPSVFLVTGMKSLDDNIDTQPIFEGFLQQHYHKPSDDLNLPIDYGAAAKFTRINVKIGEMIANEPTRPSWHEGDFFGRTYAK